MAALMIGINYVGEVDRVDNLFYVKTRAFVLMDFPVIPLGSYAIVIRPGPQADLAVPIGFSLKSWMMGFLRPISGLLVFASIIWFCVITDGGKKIAQINIMPPIITGLTALIFGIVSITVRGIARATPARAAEIARAIDLPEESLPESYRHRPTGFEVVPLPAQKVQTVETIDNA